TGNKPVGLVHFAVAGLGATEARHETFGAIGREAVRLAAVRAALQMLVARLEPA
ncbi:MAG TPA: CinA family protein, partial [Caulobacteraceae bacterium]